MKAHYLERSQHQAIMINQKRIRRKKNSLKINLRMMQVILSEIRVVIKNETEELKITNKNKTILIKNKKR